MENGMEKGRRWSDMNVIETANRILLEREKLGLTQAQMAEQVGVTVSNYKKIEEGASAMSLRSLRSIHDALELTYDYLLAGERKTLEEIARQINTLCKEEQMIILKHLLKKLSGTEFDETTILQCMGIVL